MLGSYSIVVANAVLSLPATSREVIEILLTPSGRLKEYDQFTDESRGTASTPLIQIEELVSLLPERICCKMFVASEKLQYLR